MTNPVTFDNKQFLISEILNCELPVFSKETIEKLNLITRNKTSVPIIYIGMGTCGIVAGAEFTANAIRKYIQEKNIKAEVIEVGCLGLCSAEPLVDIQLPGKTRVSFENITEEKVEALLDGVFNYSIPGEFVLGQFTDINHEDWDGVPYLHLHPFFANQQRVVLQNCGIINPGSVEDYIARGGYKTLLKTIRNYTSEKVCDIIDDSALRGRGGGGFRTGKKWKIAHSTASDEKYLICNADESDPGAFMDRAIIEGDTHRLLEGIAIAAYAIGASKAMIYIRAEYMLATNRLKKAISQAKEYGLLGDNINGSGFNLSILIKQGAGAFVCGEETALINSIEGRRGQPHSKPPFPAIEGLFNKPTVVNNVETLANIPSILENGAMWFQSIGTKESKGTKVFAMTGKIKRTGLVEIPMGTKLEQIIFDICDGIKDFKKFKAVQIGGPSGSCITSENLNIEIDYDSLVNIGAIMGSGGMVVMDEDTCMVDIAKYFMNFLQKESCGKCIPCREGTRRMHEILENITKRPVNESGHETLERFKGIMQLESLAEVIRTTSLCGLGQTAPNPLLSTLKWFREEYEEHIFDRKCRAGVCKELRLFYIDVEKCTGCTLCIKKCPAEAIIGTPRAPHFIIEEKCTGCGICFDICKFVAVSVK